MKAIIVSFDGHVNSTGFKSWAEAREFIYSRVPEKAKVLIDWNLWKEGEDDLFWTKFEYAEKRGTKLLSHVWEINEVEVMSSRSS